jgi:hypothetical protein
MFKEYSNKVKKYLKEEDVPFKEYADKIKKWIKEEAYEFDERPDIETKLTIDIKEDIQVK